MNWLRISTIMQKNLLLLSRDLIQVTDLIYWPLLDIILWGFASSWSGTNQDQTNLFALTTLTALTLFHIMNRVHMDVAIGLAHELWDRNLVNLFSSPLSTGEWSLGVMLLGIIKSSFTILFCSAVIWGLHGLNVFSLGWLIIPLIIALIFSGWTTGFFIAGLLLYWGQRAQGFIWSIGWLFAAFCGVFYPTTILPYWAQAIARLLPMTYVFEGVRYAIAHNSLPAQYIYVSITLSVGYFLLAYFFFKRMFLRSRVYGLSRLEQE
jgi:ABC-2 type transport system permease protein